jgi:hypothetical protein
VSLIRILNSLSFAVLFSAYVLTGYVVSVSGEYYARMVRMNLPGRPLPTLTELMLFCDGSAWPIYLAVLIGLAFLDCHDQTRRFVPIGLTIAWGLCALHLLAFVIAVGLIAVPQSIH